MLASLYWSLFGVLLSALSTCFLINDLKNRRTYLLVGGEDTSDRKVVIRRDRSPLFFNFIVVGVALCTVFTLVTCLVVLFVGEGASASLLAMDSWKLGLAFLPSTLVVMYVLQSISVRVFAGWWDV